MAPKAPSPRPATRTSFLRTAALPLTLLTALLTALVLARWGPLLSLDISLATTLHRTAVAAPAWTGVNRLLTDWAWDPWTMRAVLAAVVLWLVRRGARPLAVWVTGTALLGTALQQALKAVVGRARPVWPDPVDSAQYAAFPSGHAMSALVAGGLVLWVLRLYGARAHWRWAVRAVVTVSVIGVGFTRIYMGVHWTSDVLGGWLLGGALVAGATAAYGRRAGGPGARTPGQGWPGAARRTGWPS
ncbi:phosphatase PAP2 family protein [Streptomyces sp. NPDC048483]|uniref:phosphatase PAP2 family protein n=1 Tax=Streptomyces sp. NPDC048483 TaxID=3154927 RepID=UPI003416F329